MVLTARVEPIDRDVQLLINEMLSPAARSQQLAEFAAEFIQNADNINREAFGRIVPHKVFVDGREGAALQSVRPDGVIVAEWELIGDLFVYLAEQLRKFSPVLTGRYQKSHTLFADGAEVPIGAVVPLADEYVIMSALPYARKIERGESKQAPHGVYELVAAQARKRFGNIARVNFSFRTAIGTNIIGGRLGNRSEQRNPAIIVTVK